MRCLLLSDIHEQLIPEKEVPKTDLVFIAGDFSYRKAWDIVSEAAVWHEKYKPWFQIFKDRGTKVVATAGNHDSLAQVFPHEIGDIVDHFILNATIEVNGLKIFATPFSLPFWNWAFNLSEENLCELLAAITESVDVIISHGPPFGILDSTKNGKPLGSYALLHMIERLQPKLCLFGHIHEGRGLKKYNRTWCVNASNVYAKENKYIRRTDKLMVWESTTNVITFE